ncbi:MAG: hypothetical protein ABR612_14235 [Chromatocurvus sp.]
MAQSDRISETTRGRQAGVSAGNVTEETIEGHQVTGVMKSADDSGDASGQQPLHTYIPEVGDTEILDLLEGSNVAITAKESGRNITVPAVSRTRPQGTHMTELH